MFIHNFKYSFKTLFKDKMLIFWTFAFPIILGTFFYMAFSDIENSEKLDIIDIAIVDNEEFNNNQVMKEAFKLMGDKTSDEQLFNIKYVSESEAKELLEEDAITGYLIVNDTPKVVIGTNGINETIFKFAVEEISLETSVVNNIVDKKVKDAISEGNTNFDVNSIVESIYDEIPSLMSESSIVDITSENLSYTMIEYYTLIAMTCLYGGILGMVSINNNLANMSNKGKRVSVSPTSKGKLIFSSVLASYLIQLMGIVLLFVYTIFVLNVDYGSKFLYIILLTLFGSFAGLTLGIFIATMFKTNENAKSGILISITMLGCFLSGMMGITMKYIVDSNVPILNKINPASMITDGLYSLYYYEGLDRFWFNVVSLAVFSGILLLISIFSLRRQRYDSI